MIIQNFHFIRPEWLILLPIATLVWLLILRKATTTQWKNHLPKAALKALQIDQDIKQNMFRWWLLLIWVLLIISAAGPSWIKQAVPSVSNQRAVVVVLDLSPSMLTQDVKPDRITLARFELLDILSSYQDGQVGLVAYSGTAHKVSPLTDDPSTVASLVPALSPEFMPETGSNVEAAISQAEKLLDDSGISSGQIILITDGVSETAIDNIAVQLKTSRSISILGIGKNEPAPIPNAEGGFLRDSKGDIVLTKLNVGSLQRFATATGGLYASQTANDSDTRSLVDNSKVEAETNMTAVDSVEYDSWQDMAYILVLAALPLFLLFFRKGVIYALLVFTVTPFPSEAQQEKAPTNTSHTAVSQLFVNNNQRAARMLENGNNTEAAKTFTDDKWSAIASYRADDYHTVVQRLDALNDVSSLYNKANALALSGQLDKAIETYEQVLTLDPEHEDASYNKDVVEKLLNDADSSNSQKGDQSDSKESKGEDQTQSNNEEGSDGENSPSDSSSKEGEKNPSKESKTNSPNTSDSDETDKSGSQDGQETNSLSEQSEKQANSEDNEGNEGREQQDQRSSENTKGQEAQPDASDNQKTELEMKKGLSEKDSSDNSELENTVELSSNSEQWLRSIEDDPAGLLRRKFEYQAWQRKNHKDKNSKNLRVPNEERY